MIDKKIKRLLVERKVEIIDNYINVNNFVDNIIESIDKIQYIKNNIKDINLINNVQFMSFELCKELLNKSTRKKAMEILKLCKNDDTNESIIDPINGKYKYKGQHLIIFTYTKNNETNYLFIG